jgi:hypothetical protein
MKLFFIALSLFAIIKSCYSATPAPAKVVVQTAKPVQPQPPQECHLLPPGLERLRHGVDAETFDMFPPDLSAPEGFVKPIFDFTCNQNKKWMDPYTNTVYDLPDQVASITKEDSESMNQNIDFHNDYQNILKLKVKKRLGNFRVLVTPKLPKVLCYIFYKTIEL